MPLSAQQERCLAQTKGGRRNEGGELLIPIASHLLLQAVIVIDGTEVFKGCMGLDACLETAVGDPGRARQRDF
jgi:hypothetical protein